MKKRRSNSSSAARLRDAIKAAHKRFVQSEWTREQRAAFFAAKRKQQLNRRRVEVSALAAEFSHSFWRPGKNSLDTIAPSIEIVRTAEQRRLFKYCRLMSLYPYTEPVGRRLSFIVWDTDGPSRSVVGIGCLSSPVRNIGVRDKFIGWNGGKGLRSRRLRLNAIVDLSVCVAVPPFSSLAGGKLIALLAVCNEMRNELRGKFPSASAPVLVTTTSIFGRHSTVYNRIRYRGLKLYQLIGETAGYGHVHVSDRLFARLRSYLESHGTVIDRSLETTHNFRFKILSRAIRKLGLNERVYLRHNLTKGVFVAPLTSEFRTFLTGGIQVKHFYDLPAEGLIDFWRERWFLQRLRKAYENAQALEFITRDEHDLTSEGMSGVEPNAVTTVLR